MKKLFVFISYLICVFSAASLNAAEILNLKQVVQLNLQNSKEIDQYKKDLEIAQREEKNAYYKFFPSLKFSTSVGWQDSDPQVYQSPWASRIGLNLSENLYDNGVSFNNYQVAQNQLKIAELNLKNKKNELTESIAENFFDYIYKLKKKTALEEQNQIIKKQFLRAEKDYQQGYKSEKDYLRFKTDLSRSAVELNQINGQVKSSKMQLISSLFLPLESIDNYEFSFQESNLFPVDFNAIKISIEEIDFFRIQTYKQKIYDLKKQLSSRDNWPKINFNIDANYYSHDFIKTGESIADNKSMQWQALFTLEYSLWDWGSSSRNAEINQIEIEKGRNDLAIQKILFLKKIEDLYIDIDQNKETYKLSKELYQLEEKNTKNLENGYRSGSVSYLEFNNGLQNLIEARINLINVEFYLQKNQLLLWSYQGNLYEKIQY